jgi:hypothetical protein
MFRKKWPWIAAGAVPIVIVVAWPAAHILGRVGMPEQAIPILIKALNDPDKQVRLKAISSLAVRGPDARSALDALVRLLGDPDAQVAYLAEWALWEIHAPTALKAGGWKEFKCDQWNFAATFPGEPEKKDDLIVAAIPGGASISHPYQAAREECAIICIVSVTEWPQEFIESTKEDERFDRLRRSLPEFFGEDAKLLEDKLVEQGPLRGREFLIEKDQTQLRHRCFWIGQRQYSVMVSFPPRFVTAKAANYFLDSFRVKDQP